MSQREAESEIKRLYALGEHKKAFELLRHEYRSKIKVQVQILLQKNPEWWGLFAMQEEMIDDCLLKVHNSLRTHSDPESIVHLNSWIRKIVLRTRASALRSAFRVQRQIPCSAGDEDECGETDMGRVPAEEATPEESLLSRELLDAFGVCLATLELEEPAVFEAFVLHYCEGKTFREVGEILGISTNQASSRTYAGLRLLRAWMSKKGHTTFW